MSLRLLQPGGSYKNLAGTTAETPTTLDIGELPTLGIYGGFRRLPL
jgi:hypothetical protein